VATAGEIVAAALAEGGIDATPAQGLVWLNDRHKRLVGGSKWRKLQRNLGTTVVDQAVYPLGDDVVDLLMVRVDLSAPYISISLEELWELQASATMRITRQGLFAPHYDDDSEAESFELFPAPSEAGKAITGIVAVLPPTLLVGDTPKIPEDFHLKGLKSGVIADGLSLIDEANADASYHEQQWQDALEALTRRRKSRVGKGPQRIQLRR
jgi:hypothetical protein